MATSGLDVKWSPQDWVPSLVPSGSVVAETLGMCPT